MRNAYKILLLAALVVSIVIAANWLRFLLMLEYVYSTGTIWIIVGLILSIPFILWLSDFLELKKRLSMSRRLQDKRIPQPQRIDLGKSWVEEHWRSRTAGKYLNLVNNYITPYREDARPTEVMLFTTAQAFAGERIDEGNLSPNQRFYVFVDCISGECFTIDEMNRLRFMEAIKFVNQYWFMGIKQKVETPIEQWMKKAIAESTGQQIVKQEMEKKEETKEVKE